MTLQLRIFLFILFFTRIAVQAQNYSVESHQVGKMGASTDHFIQQMSNGSTVLLIDVYKSKAILLQVFRPDHSLALEKRLKMDSVTGFVYHRVVGISEVSGRVCLFYTVKNLKKKYEQLYRLEINLSDGNCYNETLMRVTEPDHFMEKQLKVIYNGNDGRYTIAAVIEKGKAGHELTALTYSPGQKLIDKYTRTFTDSYQVYLVDGIREKDELYFCIDFKLHPKESEKDAFGDPKYIYLPGNKVYMIRHRLGDRLKEELLLPLKESYYIVKGQFTFDQKHQEVNFLFSGVNPLDSYRRVASIYNMFYKFSQGMFQLLSEREIKNDLAIKQTENLKDLNSKSPVEPNRKNFVSYPQFMCTDSTGKTCLVMQTVYNFYHGKEANASADLRMEDFAIYQLSREGEIEKAELFPYCEQYGIGYEMGIDKFSFNCGKEIFYSTPYEGLTILNTGKNRALICNPISQNVGKKFGDELTYPNHTHKREAILTLQRPNVSSAYHILPETEGFHNVVLSSENGSFNASTNAFASLALEPGSSKRWLVWIYFKK